MERLIFNRGYRVQAAEDYQLIKTRAPAALPLTTRASSLRGANPPCRPGSRAAAIPGQEFFFRFVPPLPGDNSPVI